eukprot:242180-Hanusia_phi.AAC.1
MLGGASASSLKLTILARPLTRGCRGCRQVSQGDRRRKKLSSATVADKFRKEIEEDKELHAEGQGQVEEAIAQPRSFRVRAEAGGGRR